MHYPGLFSLVHAKAIGSCCFVSTPPPPGEPGRAVCLPWRVKRLSKSVSRITVWQPTLPTIGAVLVLAAATVLTAPAAEAAVTAAAMAVMSVSATILAAAHNSLLLAFKPPNLAQLIIRQLPTDQRMPSETQLCLNNKCKMCQHISIATTNQRPLQERHQNPQILHVFSTECGISHIQWTKCPPRSYMSETNKMNEPERTLRNKR